MQGPSGNQVVSLAAGDPCAGATLLAAEARAQIGQCTDMLNFIPSDVEASCRVRLSSCTPNDRQVGDQYLNCLRRLEPCTPANRATLSNRERVCAMTYVTSIRNACLQSLWP